MSTLGLHFGGRGFFAFIWFDAENPQVRQVVSRS